MIFRALPLLILLSGVAGADEIKAIDGATLSRSELPPAEAELLKRSSVTSIAYATPTSLLFVEKRRLGLLNLAVPAQRASAPISMPGNTSRIAVGPVPGTVQNAIYAFGKGAGKDAIYAYSGAGKFTLLAETPKPITALSTAGQRLLFAMDNSVYSVQPGQGIKLVFASDIVRDIRSIAFDSELDIVYFADSRQIYALRSGMADVILQGYSGMLRVLGNDLLVEGPEGVLRLSGLKDLLQKGS